VTTAACISYKWQTTDATPVTLPNINAVPYFSAYGPTTLTLGTGGMKFIDPLSKTVSLKFVVTNRLYPSSPSIAFLDVVVYTYCKT